MRQATVSYYTGAVHHAFRLHRAKRNHLLALGVIGDKPATSATQTQLPLPHEELPTRNRPVVKRFVTILPSSYLHALKPGHRSMERGGRVLERDSVFVLDWRICPPQQSSTGRPRPPLRRRRPVGSVSAMSLTQLRVYATIAPPRGRSPGQLGKPGQIPQTDPTSRLRLRQQICYP